MRQQKSLPALQQQNSSIVATYGQRAQFLASFNPDMQTQICANSWDCIAADVPTLAQVNAAYGCNTATMWLIPQLLDLSEFCGCRDKLQGKPLEQCAAIIATEYHYLKPTELMLFFYRFKQGRYGRFYGSVDPLVITTALRDFIQERATVLVRHELQQRQAEYDEYKQNAITYEQHLAQRQ